MMKKNLILLMFTIAIISCNKSIVSDDNLINNCVDDKDYGEIRFSEKSEGFDVYRLVDTLIFENQDGVQIIFTNIEEQEDTLKAWRTEPCEFGDVTDYYYTVYHRKRILVGDTMDLKIIFYLRTGANFLSEESIDLHFWDKLDLTLSISSPENQNGDIGIVHITDDRGHPEVADLFNTTFSDELLFFNEKEILGNIFQNIFFVDHNNLFSGFGPKELYFSTELGVVGFRDYDRNLWVLKEIR